MIRITRKWQVANAARAYKIYINGVLRGKIRANDGTNEWKDEIIEFPVKNGRHTIYAKMDWYKSNMLCVDVSDSIVDVEVGCFVTGWRIFFYTFYRTFFPHRFLWLREVETVDEPPGDVE